MIRVEKTSEISAASADQRSDLYPIQMPLLLTEAELIELLRIPEVAKSSDHRNVVENLKRMHDLPCIHICRKPLYPLEAVRKWVLEKAEKERQAL